jgi:mono/diheme cytochrome c family protein
MTRIGALWLAVVVCAATASSTSRVHAQQSRSARDGVYTDVQAKRGEAISRMGCVACHGPALTGDIAPPLAGQDFLSVWGKQPLSNLFDKVNNTMPADALGTLTRPQVADLIAYILQANRFPAGSAELASDEAVLRQISLAPAPATIASAPATAPPGMSFPAVGNLNQVMRGTLFPSSNVLFDVQTQDPGARQKGARPDAATTTARYGDVYDPWAVVDAAAIAIAEAGPMLMTPGRRCENGKPVPVDRADWQRYVQGLVEVGRAAYRAAQTRSQAAVSEVTNQISDACANCHRVYRDTPSAATRCTPP